MNRTRSLLLLAGWAGALIVLRALIPERPLEAVGLRALADMVFALGFAGLVIVVTGLAGTAMLRPLRLQDMTRLERISVASALGIGVLAVGNTFLAFLGMLSLPISLAWLGALSIASVMFGDDPLPRIRGIGASLRGWFRERSPGEKLGLPLLLLILAAAVLMALTPTWDYDGLMYHLQAPRLLLEQGTTRLMPDLWQANGPLYAEMVYALGLRLGSDTFAKLMHVWLGILFVLGTMALGGRVLRREDAWLSGLLVVGVPLLPFWAGAAYTDLGWAAFETLALVCLVSWLQAPSTRWLVLAGTCAGLACGTKPLALLLLPIACAALLSGGLWSPRAVLARWATFLLPAALVAAPWYLKNLLLAGNPFYPLLFGGPEWPAERTALLADYLASFGMGEGIWDYAMLPVRVFTQPEAFGTFSRSLEFPSLLFIAAPFYAATRRDRLTRVVALITVGRIALWSLGSQQTRFLLPVFPCLAVLSAGSLRDLSRAWSASRWLRHLPMAVILAWLVLVLVFSAGVPGLLWFQDVVVGRESKAEFLRRMVGDYLASEYIQSDLPETARVLLMWDGRGFYCDERCLPDAEQSRWTWYFQRTGTVAGMAALLEAEGITHLYHSFGDSLFILEHDRSGANRLAEEFFLREFRRRCTRLLSPDPATEIYELTCRGDP